MLRRLSSCLAMALIAVSVSACGGANTHALPTANSATNVAPSWDKKSIVMVIRAQPTEQPTVQPSAQPTTQPASGTRAPQTCPLSVPGGRSVQVICCGADCPPRPTPTPHPVALAQIIINVPAPSRQNIPHGVNKQPRYVSAATNSAQITLSQPAAGYPSTYATDCVPNADSTKTCTINNVGAQPATNETFTASVFTGTAETGSLLGKGSTVASIIQGQNNQIGITLSPVIVEIGFDLSTDAISNPVYGLALPQGTATTFPLTIAAFDPAGNEVPTPANGAQYLDTTATPFTVSATVQLDAASPAGTITLSSSTFTAPSSPTVTGNYTGATLGAGANISTSVSTSDPNVFIDPPVTVTN